MDAIKRIWCSWMHGGGTVKRDPLGRINWQCAKCGRWCDPLSSADEASPAVDAIRDFAKMRGLSLDDAKVQDWQDIARGDKHD